MAHKVYIVDRSKQIPRLVAEILGPHYEVKSSTSADLALLEIIAWKPDLLITGVEIGNITGFDLCMILKMMPQLASVPVILLSSHKDKETLRRLAEVGADYYIEKNKEAFAEIEHTVHEVFHDQGSFIDLAEKAAHTVLLVDDSILVRTVLANMLECAGVEQVLHAEHGEEALACLAEQQVDLVVTDFHMPVMDGATLVRKLRERQEFSDLPIIVATAEDEHNMVSMLLDQGANGVLLKPVSCASLNSMLASFRDGSIFTLGAQGHL